MEAGEFRQGPIEVVDQDFGAIVYVLEGEAGLLNCRLAEDIRLSGGRVYLVGKGVLCEKDGPLVFQIPCGETIFQPVLEVVPSQILAYKLAEAQGLKPGQVRYITKVITTEIGLPGEATSTS
jgi:glucosamine--fructose-6-phosphate aminotransferase (isomerizing)